MNYTKWHIGDVRSFGGYYIYDKEGRLVTECSTVQGVDKLANANLIASAPDLYEALEDLVSCFRNIEVLSSIQDDEERHLLGVAVDGMKQALAKAREVNK